MLPLNIFPDVVSVLKCNIFPVLANEMASPLCLLELQFVNIKLYKSIQIISARIKKYTVKANIWFYTNFLDQLSLPLYIARTPSAPCANRSNIRTLFLLIKSRAYSERNLGCLRTKSWWEFHYRDAVWSLTINCPQLSWLSNLFPTSKYPKWGQDYFKRLSLQESEIISIQPMLDAASFINLVQNVIGILLCSCCKDRDLIVRGRFANNYSAKGRMWNISLDWSKWMRVSSKSKTK